MIANDSVSKTGRPKLATHRAQQQRHLISTTICEVLGASVGTTFGRDKRSSSAATMTKVRCAAYPQRAESVVPPVL